MKEQNKGTVRILIIALTALLLSSCGSGLDISRSRVKYFTGTFSAKIENKSFQIEDTPFVSTPCWRVDMSPSFLNIFEVEHGKVDSVELCFKDSDELEFIFNDNGHKNTEAFKGRFTGQGYYEYYVRDNIKEIPPLIPLILGERHIHRIRIALTVDDNLIVDDYWNESGNILIFGGGGSHREQVYFRCKRLA